MGDPAIDTQKAYLLQCCQKNFCLGDPLIPAPELFDDSAYVSDKLDMWYMGCILYRICTRKSAFDATSFELLRKNIIETSPEMDLIKRTYSLQMMTCIKSLLSTNPEDRIATQDLMNTQFVHRYIDGISYNNNTQYRINITDRQQDNQ